MNIMIR